MDRSWGILGKIFLWQALLAVIFFGTIGLLYYNTLHLMKISDEIVNKSYRLLDAAKVMVEQLLIMEEKEKKYLLLHHPEYKEAFQSAMHLFEASLQEAPSLTSGHEEAVPLERVAREFHDAQPELLQTMERDIGQNLWIPEETLDRWARSISVFKEMQERRVASASHQLHRQGGAALRWGLWGIGLSLAVGLMAALFLPAPFDVRFGSCSGGFAP